MGKRQSPRIRCRVKSTLEYQGRIYQGYVENISDNGLLMRLAETVLARPGDGCRLALYYSDGKAPLKLKAEMVHVGFSMAGVRFHSLDENGRSILFSMLQQFDPVADAVGTM